MCPQRHPEPRGRMKKPPPSRDIPGGRILPWEGTDTSQHRGLDHP